MGNFRPQGGRGFDRGRSGGNRFGGGFNRDRDSFRRDREMHDVVCTKCKKDCRVPFKPTGDKPVLCSDCFRQSGDSRGSRGDRDNSRSVDNSAEIKKINVKLDKIIAILQNLEIVEDEELDDGEESDEDEEDAENNDDENSTDGDNVVYEVNEDSDSEDVEEVK